MNRVGIFGGSFDPVHLGHLLVAFAAREEMYLDRLIFVPANRSPFKQERQPPAPEHLRMRMLRLALAGLGWCEVSDMEFQRGGVSYTVDTIQDLRQQLPDCKLFLLIGEDNLHGLSAWHEAETLARLVEFLVIPRPGVAPPTMTPGVKLHWLKGWPIEVSSSHIRERIRKGLPIDHLVAPAVGEVIRHKGLYLP